MCIIIKSRCFAEVFQHVCIIFYATFRVTFNLPQIPVEDFESFIEKINPEIKNAISPQLKVIELELPVIHDLTDRRISIRADFHKIQIPFSG